MALLFSKNNFSFSHKDKAENMLIYDNKWYLEYVTVILRSFFSKKKKTVTSGIYQGSSIGGPLEKNIWPGLNQNNVA